MMNNSSSVGQWEVSGSRRAGFLYLQFQNGAEAEYQLSERNGSLYLNGTKYFRKAADC
jgi:hypothetical protein